MQHVFKKKGDKTTTLRDLLCQREEKHQGTAGRGHSSYGIILQTQHIHKAPVWLHTQLTQHLHTHHQELSIIGSQTSLHHQAMMY